MSGVQTLQIKQDEDGMRLDRWFKVHFPDLTYGRLQKLLRTGQVRVNGSRTKANVRLEEGQQVRIPPLNTSEKAENEEENSNSKKTISQADIEFVKSLVIYKDDDIIALNKPSGLAVQGGSKTERHLDGLLDGLKFKEPERPRLVHRLDKDTSGVLLLARNRKAATALGQALKDRAAKKVYWALVNGVPRYEGGEINLPLIKKGCAGQERVRIADRSDKEAMKACTYYQIVEAAGQKMAWLSMMPVTGRTHQLRIHSVALGHPIVGDGKYAGADAHPGGEIPRKLHLHAHSIEIPHPQKKKGLFKIEAPLSGHMLKSWKLLNFDPAYKHDFEFEKP